MKITNSSGIGAMVSGLLIAATPIVFPVCAGLLKLADGRSVPMRCFWTERAAIMLGVLLFLVGVVLTFTRSLESRQRLNHTISFLGLAVVLTPLVIIPTCTNPEMACNVGAKPAWLILGGITFVMGLWGSRAPKPELAAAAG